MRFQDAILVEKENSVRTLASNCPPIVCWLVQLTNLNMKNIVEFLGEELLLSLYLDFYESTLL